MKKTGKEAIAEAMAKEGLRRVNVGTGRIGNFEMAMPAGNEFWVQQVLAGRYNHEPRKCDKGVSRVLDLGAGCGEFAVWAAHHWPGCWIDAVEIDSRMFRALVENRPPGTAAASFVALSLNVYQVVRIASLPMMLSVGSDALAWKMAKPKDRILIIDLLEWGEDEPETEPCDCDEDEEKNE
jgi:SAM-dependent methyltransferase